MTDNVLLNKLTTIERCIKRIKEEYADHEQTFLTNFTQQDSIILNLQRACEAAIDAAMHLVSQRGLNIPQQSREAFASLESAGILPKDLSEKMQRMEGFRNIAIHDYVALDMQIVVQIIEYHLQDFSTFTKTLLPLV